MARFGARRASPESLSNPHPQMSGINTINLLLQVELSLLTSTRLQRIQPMCRAGSDRMPSPVFETIHEEEVT